MILAAFVCIPPLIRYRNSVSWVTITSPQKSHHHIFLDDKIQASRKIEKTKVMVAQEILGGGRGMERMERLRKL